MKYLLATFMSIIILTFVACSDEAEDTAIVDDTAVVDAGSDSGEGEVESSDADAGEMAGTEDAADDQDGGSEDE